MWVFKREERRPDERRWEGARCWWWDGRMTDRQLAAEGKEKDNAGWRHSHEIEGMSWKGAGWAWWASDSRPALCFNRPLILAASPTLNFSSQWLKLLTFNNLSYHFDFARSTSMGAPTKVALFKMEVVSWVCVSRKTAFLCRYLICGYHHKTSGCLKFCSFEHASHCRSPLYFNMSTPLWNYNY